MSIHPSLRGVDNLVGERSVFTRLERIQILMKAGKFDPASGTVHGLPKVRTRFKTVGKKKGPAPEESGSAEAPAAEDKDK